MRTILIVYSRMVTGGSTTSLLSLLNGIDYSKYQVDLQLYDNSGELQDQINPNVTVLSEIKPFVKQSKKRFKCRYWIDLLKARVLSKKHGNRLINAQFMARYEAEACARSTKQYDIGISFLEFWPMEYLVRNVHANKKIGWIHIDIKEAGLLPRVNLRLFQSLDSIVLVSKSCVDNMISLYPQLKNKIKCIENILVKDTVTHLAQSSTEVRIENTGITFVSVCRLVCASKGLDRALAAFDRLKKEGLLSQDVRWYIIGDGPDRKMLDLKIKEAGLTETVILLGQHKNPYAIEKNMKYFLLPSRYEGKPMAVTEAQMIGLVPLVCNYSSATEQITSGVDGIVCENNDEAIYYVIRDALQGKLDYDRMKAAILDKDYSNVEEIEKIYQLFQSEGEV